MPNAGTGKHQPILSPDAGRRQRRHGGRVAASQRARDLGLPSRVLANGQASARGGRGRGVPRAARRRRVGVGRARQPRRQYRQRLRGGAAGGARLETWRDFDLPTTGWMRPSRWATTRGVASRDSSPTPTCRAAVASGRRADLGEPRPSVGVRVPLLGITGNDLTSETLGSLVRDTVSRRPGVARPEQHAADLGRLKTDSMRFVSSPERCMRDAASAPPIPPAADGWVVRGEHARRSRGRRANGGAAGWARTGDVTFAVPASAAGPMQENLSPPR